VRNDINLHSVAESSQNEDALIFPENVLEALDSSSEVLGIYRTELIVVILMQPEARLAPLLPKVKVSSHSYNSQMKE